MVPHSLKKGWTMLQIASQYYSIIQIPDSFGPIFLDICYVQHLGSSPEIIAYAIDETPNLQLELLGYYIAKLSLLERGCLLSDLRERVQVLHDLQLSRRVTALAAIREKHKQQKVTMCLGIVISIKDTKFLFEDVKELIVIGLKNA
ncbi:hypothetical protein Tco_0386971 [Tanacetum coccineum]